MKRNSTTESSKFSVEKQAFCNEIMGETSSKSCFLKFVMNAVDNFLHFLDPLPQSCIF